MLTAFYLTILLTKLMWVCNNYFHVAKIICKKESSLPLNLQSQILDLGSHFPSPVFLFLCCGSQFLNPKLEFTDLRSWVLGFRFWVLGPNSSSNYYKEWQKTIANSDSYYKVYQKIITPELCIWGNRKSKLCTYYWNLKNLKNMNNHHELNRQYSTI